MPFLLSDELSFPSPDLSDEDGLLAMDGDLSPERLCLAYANGIFPWFEEGSPILWWSPDPRFILFPNQYKKH
jgi:leucyl/phenylalanyl-tRNA--protein transferase